MRCGDDMPSLINAIYSQLLTGNQQLPDQYFLHCTIFNSRNAQVHEINTTILNAVAPQEKFAYLSADSVTDQEYDYIQPERFLTLSIPLDFPFIN